MAKKLPLLLLLFTALSFSQKPSFDFKKTESEIRRLVYIAPDSALTLIKQTLRQKNIHDTVYANTYNLYGVYHGMRGDSDSLIYYLKKSLPYARDYPKIMVRGLINISVGYRNKSDYKTAISYLNKALAINRKINDKVGIAMVYGELASNYNYMLEYDKSVNYLLKAIEILKAEKNTSKLVAIKQKLANTYLAKENFQFAIDLYKECLPEFKELGMDKNYYLTHINIGEAYIRLENFREAKKNLQEAIGGLERFGDKELLGITYSKIANIERSEGQKTKAINTYDKAVSLLAGGRSSWLLRIGGEYINLLNDQKQYQKALSIIESIENAKAYENGNPVDKMVYMHAKADTYSETGNDTKAIDAYRSTISLLDTISAREKEGAVQEIQAKFQTELQREKNLALQASNAALTKSIEAEKRLTLLYIAISIVIIILILSFLRGYWLRNRLQQEELKAIEAENNLIKQQHEHEQELINAQQGIIEEKQRELTSMALRMANYQDNLNEVIKKCDANIFSKVNDVKKELLHLSKQKDYWNQFEKRFNSLHPEFSTTLTNRFSKLTKNDVEFCSLLKLNLSNKEIASLLQISHESAITKKYRIKKKMEINDDEEFERILMEI